MGRPAPEILLENIDKTTYKSEQVLAGKGIWAVYYQGQPINLKSSNAIANTPGPKYKKTSFTNRGHALNLAKKLNEMFNTKDFDVREMAPVEIIEV